MKRRATKRTKAKTPRKSTGQRPGRSVERRPIVPGQLFLRPEMIDANVGKPTIDVDVANTGDRPIQIGSHFHFFEVNRALSFDRERAYGMRLNIAAGTAVRFEPGQKRRVSLIPLGGRREVWGLNGLVNGMLRPLEESKGRGR